MTAKPGEREAAAPLVGACLGFLPYNFRHDGARIFLGDTGASFIARTKR
jgi:UDP-N-acetylmuramyl pentapeptide phosphotransferase/UDP-N-acetylglucosamine-1-phosphate transferase